MKMFFLAVAAVAMLTVATSSVSEAKTKYQVQKHRVIRDVTPMYAGTITQVSARRHKQRQAGRTHYARRGGACDGIHRCRCGSTQTAHFGLPRIYNGHNLWLASEWLRAFPRTSFHVGAVGAQPGHVLRVVGGSSCSSATVSDDAGTYQRNVCGMTFVSVTDANANRATPLRRAANSRPVYADLNIDYMSRSGSGI